MFDREFLNSKVGHAALASILATLLFVALSTQAPPSDAPSALLTMAVPGETLDLA